ncbi:MAG TPA: DUF4954 family protein, partial [Phnomibacter sp.]|nr:DUF4954 family protein [Phnomibacter sp.]
SFLCAALIMGQSNMAAGATIGSNHNSRSPDGELIAGRGFWPGLCVSLKHNSRFASFTIIAKGDYPAEMDIPLPFSLVSQDAALNQLQVMPGYWFFYNMYALARNAWKYVDRDKRPDVVQHIEYDYLAPDTINEMFESRRLLEYLVGKAALKMEAQTNGSAEAVRKHGQMLLNQNHDSLKTLTIQAEGFENARRPVVILKAVEAWQLFGQLIQYYGTLALCTHLQNPENLVLPKKLQRQEWLNVGGQLIPQQELQKKLITPIHTQKIKSWDEVHAFYTAQAQLYPQQKMIHALASLQQITGVPLHSAASYQIRQWMEQAMSTNNWLLQGILDSRTKDYTNPFRVMVYQTQEEMNKVLGKLDENSFIQMARQQAEARNEMLQKWISPKNKRDIPKKKQTPAA